MHYLGGGDPLHPPPPTPTSKKWFLRATLLGRPNSWAKVARGGQRPFGFFPKIHLFWYRHPPLIHFWNGGWLCLSISKPKTRMLCKVSMIILSCELCKNVDWGPMSQALLQSLCFPYWAPRSWDCDWIVMVILMAFLSLTVLEKIQSLRCWWSSLISGNSIKCPIFYFTFSWIRESVVSIFHPGSSCHVNDRRQQSKNQFVIPTIDCKGQGVLSKTGRRKKTGIICEHEKYQSFETMLI